MLITSFAELLQELHNTKPQPNPKYWQTITANAKLIILEVALRNQHQVAKELNISLPKFNSIMPLLREFSSCQ